MTQTCHHRPNSAAAPHFAVPSMLPAIPVSLLAAALAVPARQEGVPARPVEHLARDKPVALHKSDAPEQGGAQLPRQLIWKQQIRIDGVAPIQTLFETLRWIEIRKSFVCHEVPIVIESAMSAICQSPEDNINVVF